MQYGAKTSIKRHAAGFARRASLALASSFNDCRATACRGCTDTGEPSSAGRIRQSSRSHRWQAYLSVLGSPVLRYPSP